MLSKSTSLLALLSIAGSAQAAPIPRHRKGDQVFASAKVLPNGAAVATALVGRQAADPSAAAGVLSLVDGLLNGLLGGILPGDVLNSTEAALNSLAGLILVEQPVDSTNTSSGTQFVIAASANHSTPVFLVPVPDDGTNTTSSSAGSASKTLMTIHVPILDETTGQMADSCLTYDPSTSTASTLAALSCTPDSTEHASQKFSFDSTTGVVEPMFTGQDTTVTDAQTPSYMVDAVIPAGSNSPGTPIDNSTPTVLIIFTPADDAIPVSTAAVPLAKVAAADGAPSASASTDDGMSATASTGEDDDGDDDSASTPNGDVDAPDTSDDGSIMTGGDMPTEVNAAKHTQHTDDECDVEDYVDEEEN